MEFCVLVLLIGIQICHGVSVCSNVTEQGASLYLSRGNGDGTGCWCILGLIGSNNDTVIVTEIKVPGGCQYILKLSTSNGFKRNYSCTTYGNFSFQLQHGKSVYIQLVAGSNSTSGFTVDISFSTKSSTLSLTCNLPISTTNPPAPAPRVTTTQNVLTQTYTSISELTQTYTSISVLTSTVEGHSDNDKYPNTNDGSVAAIIGGSVGGVCLIIAVVATICCVLKRNRKRHTDSSEDNKHGAREELPIIMENEMYVSSDDVLDNNVSSHQDVSSDQNGNKQSETNVEYAVVNKNNKPVYAVVHKNTNTLKNNLDNDGKKSNYMIGPDGDQYTIINKE